MPEGQGIGDPLAGMRVPGDTESDISTRYEINKNHNRRLVRWLCPLCLARLDASSSQSRYFRVRKISNSGTPGRLCGG